MLYFFAKIGQKPWATALIPSAGFFIASGYLGVHYFGHSLICNLLAAEASPGKREFISDRLQNLIKSVYVEVKNELNIPIMRNIPSIIKSPSIKWFCSSTLDPVGFGMSETRTGVLIGVPHRYNYEKVEDLPESMFQVRKLNFFKPSLYKSEDSRNNSEKQKTDSTLNDNSLTEELRSEAETINITKIDKNSSAGEIYANSLVLSEKGKKFSIARELFYTDSYRIMSKAFIMVLSCYMSVYLSRAAVKMFKLKEKHLASRLPFYSLAGVAGYFNFCALDASIEEHYTILADKKAMNFGREYQEGAIEYFTKIISRNKALRELIDGEKYKFDENGNFAVPAPLKPYCWTYTNRLEKALSIESEEKQN